MPELFDNKVARLFYRSQHNSAYR